LSKLLRLICCLLLAGLAACARIDPPEADGTLVVAIRETPAFFQREGDTASGYEHDLVTAFAESQGLKPKFIQAADPYELNDLALAGRVHLAASMPLGNEALQFSAPIRTVTQWIVGHNDVLGPERLSDLAGKTVEVLAGSPLADTLRGLDEKSRPLVVEVPGANEMDLLARVAGHKAELAAVHGIHLDLAVNFHPELVPLLQLPGKLEFGWAFGGEGADALRAKADAFIAAARADGTLARLQVPETAKHPDRLWLALSAYNLGMGQGAHRPEDEARSGTVMLPSAF
jgi:membrane-bound lytic murein transglycosylase F